jgi:hypothetical protein
MASPFLGLADNCTLKFDVPTGEIVTDEVGNVVDEIRSLQVRAFLKKQSDAKAGVANRLPGVAEDAWLLEGYCVSPMILPNSIAPQMTAIADFAGVEGRFVLAAPINPPYGRAGIGAIVEKSAGTKIVGWFQVSKHGD